MFEQTDLHYHDIFIDCKRKRGRYTNEQHKDFGNRVAKFETD